MENHTTSQDNRRRMMTKTKSARCWGDIFKKLLLSLTIGYMNKVLVVVVVVVVSVDGMEVIYDNDNPCGLYLDRSSIPGMCKGT